MCGIVVLVEGASVASTSICGTRPGGSASGTARPSAADFAASLRRRGPDGHGEHTVRRGLSL